MAKSKAEVNFMEHLKPLLPAGGDASELEVAAQALAGLSPEDRDLLAAVQESPYRLTTLEQFREFPANTEYFVLEPNIRKVEDVGWRYLAQHLDVLLPPELLDAIDPVPFGNHAIAWRRVHSNSMSAVSAAQPKEDTSSFPSVLSGLQI